MPSPNATQLISIPATSLENDPVPADIRAVIELFTTHLGKVAFPDVDAASLRKHADELRAEAKNVARARDALDAAIAVSETRLATLTDAATRAVAYAKIYGEAQPERQPIVAALATLTQAASPTTPSKTGKRRGRPPRQTAELFDASAAPEVVA